MTATLKRDKVFELNSKSSLWREKLSFPASCFGLFKILLQAHIYAHQCNSFNSSVQRFSIEA